MRDQLLISLFCLVTALAAVVVAAWLLATSAMGTQGIDALFLITVCLLVAAVFLFIPVQAYRQGVFREFLRKKADAALPAETQTKPAAAAKDKEGSSGGA